MQNKPIPILEKIKQQFEGLADHPDVKECVNIERQQGRVEDFDYEIESEEQGYLLVCEPRNDLRMLRLPSGKWVRAYVGAKESYTKDILEGKYGCVKVFDTYLGWLGHIAPIYADPKDL